MVMTDIDLRKSNQNSFGTKYKKIITETKTSLVRSVVKNCVVTINAYLETNYK